ncbi:hypothetical protein Zmor_009531 [Zophobas morio]|uniref:Uncharacterized protein n=1 Tax=Zophobas morio TaxID=2755281 RepID=A0AA38IH23_9CUCU|nr:hypothetical protein Zmor_009531 [Zophobas morio]
MGIKKRDRDKNEADVFFGRKKKPVRYQKCLLFNVDSVLSGASNENNIKITGDQRNGGCGGRPGLQTIRGSRMEQSCVLVDSRFHQSVCLLSVCWR